MTGESAREHCFYCCFERMGEEDRQIMMTYNSKLWVLSINGDRLDGISNKSSTK